MYFSESLNVCFSMRSLHFCLVTICLLNSHEFCLWFREMLYKGCGINIWFTLWDKWHSQQKLIWACTFMQSDQRDCQPQSSFTNHTFPIYKKVWLWSYWIYKLPDLDLHVSDHLLSQKTGFLATEYCFIWNETYLIFIKQCSVVEVSMGKYPIHSPTYRS